MNSKGITYCLYTFPCKHKLIDPNYTQIKIDCKLSQSGRGRHSVNPGYVINGYSGICDFYAGLVWHHCDYSHKNY